MEGAAKFGCLFGMQPGPIEHICCGFSCFLFWEAESYLGIFLTSWKPRWVRSCPKGNLPLFFCGSSFSSISLALSAQALNPALNFPMLFFSSNYTCSIFPWVTMHKIIINNCEIGLMLGYLKIFPAKEMSPLFSNLVSWKILGQMQKPARVFAKVSQEWSPTQLLLLFPTETFWAGHPQSTVLSPTVSQAPGRMAQ